MITKTKEALAVNPVDCDRLVSLKSSLNDKQQTLKSLDDEILGLINEDEVTTDIEQADKYKERVYEAISRIERKLLAVATPASAHATATPAAVAAPPPATICKVKLPKISLPQFGGNLLNWSSFWDSYESAVHNSHELTEVDKFNYLRSLLHGAAYDAIAGLTLSAANY